MTDENSFVKCNRCDKTIRSFSKMRKWCPDCRKEIAVLQAKARKFNKPWQEFDLKFSSSSLETMNEKLTKLNE